MMNKKLGRFKQWAGEVIGGAEKTLVSDEIQSMESEMGLRFEGMEKLQRSMALYIKASSRREDHEDGTKELSIGFLGANMVAHGQDFRDDSEYGQCLIRLGTANQRLACEQEQYLDRSINTWMDSLGRSIAQMKEYQNARRKLDQRRLAFDASIAKVHKVKNDDFRADEELRAQKAKFEETSEDVIRRMQDIREAEATSIASLTDFLDAELEYHDSCRSILQSVRNDWCGAVTAQKVSNLPSRSRSNTVMSHASDRSEAHAQPVAELIRTTSFNPVSPTMNAAVNRSRSNSLRQGQPVLQESTSHSNRPSFLRSVTNGSSRSDSSKPQLNTNSGVNILTRATTDLSLSVKPSSDGLRRQIGANSMYANRSGEQLSPYDSQISSTTSKIGDYSSRQNSPPGSALSSSPGADSVSGLAGQFGRNGPPPPPPPSRVKKAPPPPPPAKKNIALSSGRIP